MRIYPYAVLLLAAELGCAGSHEPVLRTEDCPPPTMTAKPTTLEEAVTLLVCELSDADKDLLCSMAREDLIDFHFGWGMGIRNEFGLWHDDSPLLRSCAAAAGREWIHPDSASTLIMEGVWDKLQEEYCDAALQARR